MAGNEMDIAYQWMQATLSGDLTLQGYAPGGVWRAEAQDGSTPPYITITFQPQQSKDEYAFGGVRAYSELYFEVLVAGPVANLQNISSAATRIDTLLTVSQQTSITGGTLMKSIRDQPMGTDPLIDGERWNATGGVYCLMLKAS